jgi:hypothetical protein
MMNGIKSLKSLFTLTIVWGIARSDFRFICGYFFVTGNHNKTENEILTFRKSHPKKYAGCTRPYVWSIVGIT